MLSPPAQLPNRVRKPGMNARTGLSNAQVLDATAVKARQAMVLGRSWRAMNLRRLRLHKQDSGRFFLAEGGSDRLETEPASSRGRSWKSKGG